MTSQCSQQRNASFKSYPVTFIHKTNCLKYLSALYPASSFQAYTPQQPTVQNENENGEREREKINNL